MDSLLVRKRNRADEQWMSARLAGSERDRRLPRSGIALGERASGDPAKGECSPTLWCDRERAGERAVVDEHAVATGAGRVERCFDSASGKPNWHLVPKRHCLHARPARP